MNGMAEDLSDAQIAALADFYSAQPAEKHRVRSSKRALEAVGYYIYHEGNEYTQIPPCADCHANLPPATRICHVLRGGSIAITWLNS